MAYTYAGHWGPEALLDDNGSLQKSAPFVVYLPGTNSVATTYSDSTKTHTTSSLATSPQGNAELYADPGDYDLSVNGGPVIRITVLENPAETENLNNKGQPNGYAPLDAQGLVPLANLPAQTGNGSGLSSLAGDVVGNPLANSITAGLRNSINGSEQKTNKGAANGYAPLDGSSLVPVANVPAIPESKVTGLTTDLAALQARTEKGAANGYAPLDGTGKVPTANLPSISGGGISYVPGGTSDDTAAVQNYLTNLPAGTDAIFQPGVTYTLSAPVYYKGGCRYIAPGHSLGSSPAVIQQKAGANIISGAANPIGGLFIPSGWYNNASSADTPVSFFNLLFDVNQANNSGTTAAGLVLMNSLSVIGHCYFKNGGSNPGLYAADKTRNNTTLTTVGTEPHIASNRFENCGGLYVQNSGGAAYVDGIALDNKFTGINGTAIKIDKIQGWQVIYNRVYGCSVNGIAGNGATNSIITGNLISNFGTANVAGAYYQGIAVTIVNGQGISVTNNKISCTEPSGTATFQYLSLNAGASQNGTYALVTNNELHSTGSGNALGVLYQHASGGVLNYLSSNVVVGFASGKQVYIQASGTSEIAVTPV